MAIIALKAWYIEKYEPLTEVLKRPHDLRLSRNSLLKSGLRADFLDDSKEVEGSDWFRNYLEGLTIEFYIEGSGGYVISNIDLISHEIYFTKKDLLATLEPVIFLSHQQEDSSASECLQEALSEAIEEINKQSRLVLRIETAFRSSEEPTRMSDSQLRGVRKSLLFIGDITPIIAVRQGEKVTKFPNPNVCLEVGYALKVKGAKQILLVQKEHPELEGQSPFDIPEHQQLNFNSGDELNKTLLPMLKTLLQQFNL